MELFDQLFAGTALLTVFTYLAYQLRTIPHLMWEQIRKRVIYSAHIEETSELFVYFENWLATYHENCFKNVKISLTNDNGRFEPREREHTPEEKLKLQHYSDIFILRYKGKRLMVNKGREKLENANDLRNAFFNNFRIEGWYAKQKIAELLAEVIRYNQAIRKVRQMIFTNNPYGDWINFGEIVGKSIDNLILKDKQKIIDNLSDFISKEDWYFKRGLSYKRGYLFYGAPGNGKTSLCLALANYFNRDIQFLNLNDIEKDSHLFMAFSTIRNHSFLVIEDADVIFSTREGKSQISFSALLNCMDGAFSKYGIITIMTTNHADRIDDALIREGRIDMKIKIDNPEKKQVEEYLTLFYGEEVVLSNHESTLSMSKIQEICLQNKYNLHGTISRLLPDRTRMETRVLIKSLGLH